MLVEFFDVRPGRVELSPMFGGAHLVAVALLGSPVAWMVGARGRLQMLPSDHWGVRAASWFVLLVSFSCWSYTSPTTTSRSGSGFRSISVLAFATSCP